MISHAKLQVANQCYRNTFIPNFCWLQQLEMIKNFQSYFVSIFTLKYKRNMTQLHRFCVVSIKRYLHEVILEPKIWLYSFFSTCDYQKKSYILYNDFFLCVSVSWEQPIGYIFQLCRLNTQIEYLSCFLFQNNNKTGSKSYPVLTPNSYQISITSNQAKDPFLH